MVVRPVVRRDIRGWFAETWKESRFEWAGLRAAFVQDNASASRAGTIRGLHYQAPPAEQIKLVRCTAGIILDVAVDIRHGSPTFGGWHAEILSAENHTAVWIPAGFAHGFCALTDDARVEYKCSAEYREALAFGIRWNDPALGIPWPCSNPVLSDADARWPLLADAPEHFSMADFVTK